MRKLTLKLEWTAEEAEFIVKVLGDIVLAIGNEYHDVLAQLTDARTVKTERPQVASSEDDCDLF